MVAVKKESMPQVTTPHRRRRLGTIGAAIVAVVTVVAALAPASQASSIVVPPASSLGSANVGTATLTAQLGLVTAASTGFLGVQVTASASCSDFKTGSGTPDETIPSTDVFYWSGPATVSTGSSITPGQATSSNQVSCATPQTAFHAAASVFGFSTSVTWNPTIVINIPPSAVQGTYTGTVTHTVV
jgi:hypothetical protein